MKRSTAYILTAAIVISFAASVLTANAGAADAPPVAALLERQEEVHTAAELLRELGVPEEDPAIKALSEEWWRCERLRGARYLGTYYVTGYDPYCAHCCLRADGITASGKVVTEGRTVAMCDAFPFGTEVYIEGLGTFVVEDRSVGAGRVDVTCGSHEECYALTGRYKVWTLR